MGKYSIEIKWALIFVVMVLVWMIIEKSLGLHNEYIHFQQIYTNIIIVPVIIIYVLALREKKKKYYHRKISYKESFMSGFVITLVITALSPLFQYITSEFISPEYFQNIIKYSVSEGKMSQKNAVKYYNLNNFILVSSISTFLIGIITTAIVSVFVKTKRRHRH